jgi:SNF2 family DNA or RNA helicase
LIDVELSRHGRPLVVLHLRSDTDTGAWARLQEAYARGITGGSATRLEVRADVFFAELAAIREVRSNFRTEVNLGPTLTERLKELRDDRRQLESIPATPAQTSAATLAAELSAAGFARELLPFQLENLAKIVTLPHGADFSVPGAGKTTVALANFLIQKTRGHVSQMLVIAPIAAFPAWKEDSAVCLRPKPVLTVHTGQKSLVPENTDILLTNYHRVDSDYDRIRDFVGRRPTHVVLDEAHRIKRGPQGKHGRAVLDLAYAARRRDALTGTPAPQGAYDLVALMRFLYPGQDRQILPAEAYNARDGRDEGVLRATNRAVTRYFVRTPKSRLGLPPTEFEVIRKPMRPIQAAIYEALKGTYRGSLTLTVESRRRFDRLGRIVMYLLEAATNPRLLLAGSDEDDEPGFVHPPLTLRGDEHISALLTRYHEYETPWKYNRVGDIVRDAAAQGQKVIVWSTFVRNLAALSTHLAKHQPAVVHGGVPPEDGAPVGRITREQELDRFRHDENCHVLLANPAACGEGVSLHHWCHHAVYLDRTFNAGHFLQSQDRIHRLGLRDGQLTRFTLLLSEDSIDDVVFTRLHEKVSALATLLDDVDLVRVALPEPDEGAYDPPAFEDDLGAVSAHVGSMQADAS